MIAVLAGFGQCILKPPREVRAVRQASKRVVRRFVTEPFFKLFLFRYVLDLKDQIGVLDIFTGRGYAPSGPNCVPVLVDITLLHLAVRRLPRKQPIDAYQSATEVVATYGDKSVKVWEDKP